MLGRHLEQTTSSCVYEKQRSEGRRRENKRKRLSGLKWAGLPVHPLSLACLARISRTVPVRGPSSTPSHDVESPNLRTYPLRKGDRRSRTPHDVHTQPLLTSSSLVFERSSAVATLLCARASRDPPEADANPIGRAMAGRGCSKASRRRCG